MSLAMIAARSLKEPYMARGLAAYYITDPSYGSFIPGTTLFQQNGGTVVETTADAPRTTLQPVTSGVPLTVDPSLTPAQQAASTQAQVQAYRQLGYLLKQPGYDYGSGSKNRNNYYAGLGANMQNILNLDRPSMGFDVWGALVQGAQAGVQKYESDPNKPAGPSLPSFGSSLPGISLPAWLTKPISTVSGSIISSVGAAKKADDAKAKAQAAAQGSTVTSVRQTASASSISPAMMALGVVVLGVVVLKVVRR